MSEYGEKKEFSVKNQIFPYRNIFTVVIITITFSLLFAYALFNLPRIADFLIFVVSLFLPIIYGFVIAFIINLFMKPLENLWDKLLKKHKPKFIIKRSVCMIFSMLLVATIIFAVIFLVLPSIIQATDAFLRVLPDYFGTLAEKFRQFRNHLISSGIDFSVNESSDIAPQLSQAISHLGVNFFNTTVEFTASLFSGMVNFIIAFVFAVYMLAQKESLCLCSKKVLYALCSKKVSDKIVSVCNLINRTFEKFATGQFIEALILGFMCLAGMSVFGFPYAVVVSVLVAATALIPIVGAWVGVIIGAFLIFTQNAIQALWFSLFFLVLQQIEGNLIYPKVVGKSIGLPGILVLTAVTVGGNLGGVIGMLIGVPAVSVIYVISKEQIEKRLAKKRINLI